MTFPVLLKYSEQRTSCGDRQGSRGLFVMLGWRQGMPGWADDPVRIHTGIRRWRNTRSRSGFPPWAYIGLQK